VRLEVTYNYSRTDHATVIKKIVLRLDDHSLMTCNLTPDSLQIQCVVAHQEDEEPKDWTMMRMREILAVRLH